jgi:tight adherence protein B
MLLPLIVFLFVTGLIVGTYLLAFPATDHQLERRLREVATPSPTAPEGPGSDATVVKRASEGPVPALDRLVARSGAGSSLGRLIEQSGVKTTGGAVVMFSITAAVGIGLLTAIFVPQFFFAPIGAAVLGGFMPFAWLKHKRKKRLKRFEELFPEALDILSRATRAGHAFQTSLGMAADEMPEPVGPELKKTFDQQNYGLPLRDAMNELADRVGLLDVRFFVTAVLIQRETGGNLAEILDNLAHVVRERFKILRQVRVHTAHGRFTGYVLLALPAFLAVALSYINPDHMGLLFRERIGQMMLIMAIVLQAVGYVWIRKVIKIEV